MISSILKQEGRVVEEGTKRIKWFIFRNEGSCPNQIGIVDPYF